VKIVIKTLFFLGRKERPQEASFDLEKKCFDDEIVM
jgi:hypothetical protein